MRGAAPAAAASARAGAGAGPGSSRPRRPGEAPWPPDGPRRAARACPGRAALSQRPDLRQLAGSHAPARVGAVPSRTASGAFGVSELNYPLATDGHRASAWGATRWSSEPHRWQKGWRVRLSSGGLGAACGSSRPVYTRGTASVLLGQHTQPCIFCLRVSGWQHLYYLLIYSHDCV